MEIECKHTTNGFVVGCKRIALLSKASKYRHVRIELAKTTQNKIRKRWWTTTVDLCTVYTYAHSGNNTNIGECEAWTPKKTITMLVKTYTLWNLFGFTVIELICKTTMTLSMTDYKVWKSIYSSLFLSLSNRIETHFWSIAVYCDRFEMWKGHSIQQLLNIWPT